MIMLHHLKLSYNTLEEKIGLCHINIDSTPFKPYIRCDLEIRVLIKQAL